MRHELDVNHLLQIMHRCREYEPGHPPGRPYMSACQIAICFAREHPEHPLVQHLDLGGEGAGERRSLAQRIARFLSGAAQDPGSEVGGAFISHQNIAEPPYPGSTEDGAFSRRPRRRRTRPQSPSLCSSCRLRPAGGRMRWRGASSGHPAVGPFPVRHRLHAGKGASTHGEGEIVKGQRRATMRSCRSAPRWLSAEIQWRRGAGFAGWSAENGQRTSRSWSMSA